MQAKERASQVGTGVFLIGLAALFLLPGAEIWPHIMFVVAASLLATEYSEYHTIDFRRQRVVSAAVCAVIGLIFATDFTLNVGSIWPVVLIIIGLMMIFGNRDKQKNS
jgi:uncharacterized membrane protein YgaE (UPF0421/DUF939 family)